MIRSASSPWITCRVFGSVSAHARCRAATRRKRRSALQRCNVATHCNAVRRVPRGFRRTPARAKTSGAKLCARSRTSTRAHPPHARTESRRARADAPRHTHADLCACVHVCVCVMCVCAHARVCACLYVCECVSVCACVRACVPCARTRHRLPTVRWPACLEPYELHDLVLALAGDRRIGQLYLRPYNLIIIITITCILGITSPMFQRSAYVFRRALPSPATDAFRQRRLQPAAAKRFIMCAMLPMAQRSAA
jgi:hypothetical protein